MDKLDSTSLTDAEGVPCKRNIERGTQCNISNDKNVPTDTDAYYEPLLGKRRYILKRRKKNYARF